ncbi:MAG: type II secretion system F family protein [Candidatus Rokubacteria bacterium]|nr:type II secretion system F family protein [Candidatus Rokubacteria bacterium]
MPRYAYRAKDEAGKTVAGVLEAPNEGEADSSLRNQGLFVISVREEAQRQAKPRAIASVGRISRRDLILFSIHLATILGAGIPLAAGLREFAQEATNPKMRAVAERILASVEGGALMSEAMARMPRTFPEVYVAMARAGEASGRLDRVLMDQVASLEWQDGIVRQIRQASLYPLLLLTALGGLMVLLFTFVLPRFATILTKTGAPLPLPTKIVLGVGTFLQTNWPTVALGIAAVVVGFRFLLTFPAGRLFVDRVKLRLPIFGNIILKVALGRFAHHMETLYRAGVDFVVTLTVVERVVGNAWIARAVAQVRERVMAGMSFTEALRSTGQFPPLVLRMVGSGELAGNLGDSLAKVTQYYDREVPDAVRRLFAFMEPAMIACLTVIVLGAILSVYLPIYTILSRISARPR